MTDLTNLADWVGLAATTFAAALLYAVSGFGFAVLAAPLYLLFVDPPQAVQLVIIVSTALSLSVVSGLRHAVAWGLLLRLTIGALAGLPLGLSAFRYADPLLVRLGVGATILSFALLMALRWGQRSPPLASSPGGDLRLEPRRRSFRRDRVGGSERVGRHARAAGADLSAAGWSGSEHRASTVRATLLAFFALSYGATLISHAVTIGIPGPTWIAAGILVPFAFLGGLAGRPIGDRLGAKGFRLLAIALLAAAGLYRSPARSLALQFTADRNRAAANSPDAITPHSRDAIAKGEYYAPTACARLPL